MKYFFNQMRNVVYVFMVLAVVILIIYSPLLVIGGLFAVSGYLAGWWGFAWLWQASLFAFPIVTLLGIFVMIVGQVST